MNLTCIDHQNGIIEWEMLDQLTAANAPAFKEQVLEKSQSLGAQVFILHFGKESYIDSAGIATLVTLQRKFKRIKAQIMLCTESEPIREVFFLTKLDKLFPMELTLQAALENIRSNL